MTVIQQETVNDGLIVCEQQLREANFQLVQLTSGIDLRICFI